MSTDEVGGLAGLYDLECTVCSSRRSVDVGEGDNIPMNKKTCENCGTQTMRIVNRVVIKSNRPSWDTYFTALLPTLRLRASCPRRQTSAIIIDSDHNLISTGYNGPPSGLKNCIDHPCDGANDVSGNTVNCLALHAEHNAIYYAGDRKSMAHTMYCTTLPCTKCALEILQTPIKRVVYLEDYPDKLCRSLFFDGGVTLEQFTTPK